MPLHPFGRHVAPSRTLSVDSPAIPRHKGECVLQALRLEGREGVNSLFEYQVFLRTLADFRAVDHGTAEWSLNAFVGQPLSCRIEVDGADHPTHHNDRDHARSTRRGSLREINGVVTAARLWGDEGDQAHYRLTLRPTLYRATLSADCRIFQDMAIQDILAQVLEPHVSRIDWKLSRELPTRDFQTQYNESDFAFFERLCQEWGVNYYFSHAGGLDTLVLTDCEGFAPFPAKAYQTIAFHAPGWKTDAEYLHRVSVCEQWVSREYATDDYNYLGVGNALAVDASDGYTERSVTGRVYAWHGGPVPSHYAQQHVGRRPLERDLNNYARAEGEGRMLARRRLEAMQAAGSRVEAEGNLRAMVPGCTFTLAGHPRASANIAYLVLDTHFLLEEVPQESQRIGPDSTPGWRVQVRLTAHPLSQTLRPAATRSKPFTHGPQPAVVTGLRGNTVWTDQHGRIQVRFHWHRPRDPADGSSYRNHSCWIRVASPWAGYAMGAISLPRVGQEVLVDFIGGDPDLPVCVASLYNHRQSQPWELPKERMLSGVRSREFPDPDTDIATGRGNQLVLDDTAGAIQAQLKCDHLHSELNLGHVRRIVDGKGRQDARGQGFELRTDGHGVLRAGRGVLVSTHARASAAGGMKELPETVRQLGAAHAQLEAHGRGAVDIGAQDAGDQSQVAVGLGRQNTAVAGASAGPLGELDAPHLVLASAAGIAAVSTQDLQLAAGENLALASAAHTSISAGGSLLASAARAIRFVAYRGMRLIAAQGDLEVRAQAADLGLSARHTAELASTDGWVNVTAKEGIRLNVGGTCIEITAAQIALLTEGRIATHAATHLQTGPSSRAAHLNRMPETAFDDRYVLLDEHRQAQPDQGLQVLREDSSRLGETSDAAGRTATQRSDGPDGIELRTL